VRILLLAPQPFYTERGTPIAVRLAVTALCRAGHEVDLLTLHEGTDIRLPNLRLLRIARPPLVRNVPIGFSWKKAVCDVWLAAAMCRLLRLRQYDVVHAVEESVFAAVIARVLFRFRLVYDMDSMMVEQLVSKWVWLKRVRPLLSWIELTAARRADLVLAVCPAVADYARVRARNPNVRLVPDVAFPLPADVESLLHETTPRSTRDTESLRDLFADDAPLAVYVGNLERYQGIDLLLSSIAALPPAVPCNLAVVGGGAELDAYIAKARSLGLHARVRFTGPRSLACLPALLAQADILCSPRLTGSNTPMKIYSYLAAGRAILATRIESHTQVLAADSACLVLPTPEAFTAGLLRLAQDADLRRRLGAKAAQLARESYSFEAFERRLTSAYATLLPPVAGW
jgi:glycosyltransferase involved in cell wall biosynthesis